VSKSSFHTCVFRDTVVWRDQNSMFQRFALLSRSCCEKIYLISNTQNFKTIHLRKLVTFRLFCGRHVGIVDHASNSMGRYRSWAVSSRTVCHTRRLLWCYRPGVHEFLKNPCWTVRGSNRGGGEVFCIHPDWPCQPPVRWVPAVFPGGKAAWAWRRPLTPI